MTIRHTHLREKAIELRTRHNLTLDELVERLGLPRTTIYYWIKDLPIPRTEQQSAARQRASDANRDRARAKRDAAYQKGWEEAPSLLADPVFRDFVVLYMGEGSKRQRNCVEFVNSDPKLVALANRFMREYSARKLSHRLQYHADHDPEELKQFWGVVVGVNPGEIKEMRKSNSNELSGRQFRSIHGLLTIHTADTYFRARLQAWMDFVKSQW
jgi:AcrR family transcriptional regulator